MYLIKISPPYLAFFGTFAWTNIFCDSCRMMIFWPQHSVHICQLPLAMIMKTRILPCFLSLSIINVDSQIYNLFPPLIIFVFMFFQIWLVGAALCWFLFLVTCPHYLLLLLFTVSLCLAYSKIVQAHLVLPCPSVGINHFPWEALLLSEGKPRYGAFASMSFSRWSSGILANINICIHGYIYTYTCVCMHTTYVIHM